MKSIILLLLCLNFNNLFSQLEYSNWYLNNSTFLSFKLDGSIPEYYKLNCPEYFSYCSSAISDSSGNLILFSDTKSIMNKQGEIISNLFIDGNKGDSLNCCGEIQSVIIINKPGSNHEYYIINSRTKDDKNIIHDKPFPALYTLIDMNINNGLGGVKEKNIVFCDSNLRNVTAIRHLNGEDIWIIIQNVNLNINKSYLLTKTGIKKEPQISRFNEGIFYVNANFLPLKPSPLGDIIAYQPYHYFDYTPNEDISFYKFDNFNGKITKWNGIELKDDSIKTIVPNIENYEFSPDGTKFYYYYTAINFLSKKGYKFLVQVDMKDANLKRTLLRKSFTDESIVLPYFMQLAPDGKIYYLWENNLYSINHPNLADSACDFESTYIADLDIDVPFITRNVNCLVSNLGYNVSCNSPICEGDTLRLSVHVPGNIRNPQYSWAGNKIAGQTSKDLIIPNATADMSGKIFVYVKDSVENFDYSVNVTVIPKPNTKITVDGNPVKCIGESVKLTAPTQAGTRYYWSTGDTTATIYAKKTGRYTLYGINENGCMDSSFSDIYIADFKADIQGSSLFCEGDSITLTALPSDKNFTYLWNNGDSLRTLKVGKAGKYYVTVYDTSGCSSISLHEVFTDKADLRQEDGKTYEFDTVTVNNTVILKHFMRNYDTKKVTLQKAYLSGKRQDVSLDISKPLPWTMGEQDSISFYIYHKPKFNGILKDTLFVEMSQPCPKTFTYQLNGVAVGATGVEETAQAKGITVTTEQDTKTGNINFTITGKENGKINISINDLLGNEVIAKQSEKKTLQTEVNINTNNLINGVYVFQVTLDNMLVNSGKFVIKK